MNTGFGGFMRLIFQLNSKLHFTLLMAITLYSLLLLTTYLRHLSLSPIFFFLTRIPNKTTKTKPNQTQTHTNTKHSLKNLRQREKERESSEVRTFSEKIPCCFFHLKHPQISTQVPNSTTHQSLHHIILHFQSHSNNK